MIDNNDNEVTSHVVGDYVIRRLVREGEVRGYVCDLMGQNPDDTDLPVMGWFGPGERFATPEPYIQKPEHVLRDGERWEE